MLRPRPPCSCGKGQRCAGRWVAVALLLALAPVPVGCNDSLSLGSVSFGLEGPSGGFQAYAEIVKPEFAVERVPMSRWVSLGCFSAAPGLELAVVTTVTTTTTTTTTTTDPNATTSTFTTTSTDTTTTETTTTETTTITSTSTTTTWVNCSALNATSEPNPACSNVTQVERNVTRRPSREERLAAARAAAAAMLRAVTTTTTTTTLPAAMDPAQCSQICESLKYSMAAVRGMECYCVHDRRGFTAADQAQCDFQCPVQYFNATAKFCGGADDHFSLYQEYDFMHSGAQGCLDPWRRVWYQCVAVERFLEDQNGNSIPNGYDWHLHATSIETGDPLFPYDHPLPEMVVGLHYDLDDSRVLGLTVPSWAGKAPTAKFEPTVVAVYMNSLRPENVTFEVSATLVDMTDPEIAALPEWLAVPPGLDFVTSSQATAFDSTNNVYFLTVPDIPIEGYINFDRNRPIYNYTRFSVRILGINLNEGVSQRILFNQPLPHRVSLLEVNSAFHDLFALVLDGETDQWSYVTLGTSNRSADGGPNVDFNWTFSSIPEALVDPERKQEYSNKTCQAGASAFDHWSHTGLWTMKRNANLPEPLEVMDARNAPGPGPAAKTRLGQVIPHGAQASYLMNLYPIVPWLPYPQAIDARFDMDGFKVYVKWPAHTYAGIRPIDLDGDSVPDIIDFSPRQLGARSCLDMFALVSAVYLGPNTFCEWAEAVEPYSLITIHLPFADTVMLGDELIIKNGTVFKYLNHTRQISLFSIDQVILDKPLPLYNPVIQVDWKASSNPFAPVNEAVLTADSETIGEASLCQRGELNSVLSYFHGGLPKWYWSLETVQCTTITGVDFDPNSFLVQEVRKRLAEGTVGDAVYPEGHHIVKLPRDEIEPGCVYTMKLRLYGRWDKESTSFFRITKTAPLGAINWMPPCPYLCNPATCEPPSACNAQGVCVCAPGTYGTFCSGICPTCSRRGSLGCDDGRFGSGSCICRLGYDGDLCRQRLEWREHDFGPCEGACNSPSGVRTQIMKCTNVETEKIVNASRCPPVPPPATESCTPPLCDCGVPPTVPGIDGAALERLCPSALSGGTCMIHCGANGTQSSDFTTIGLYRCYAGSYVEVPQCSPTGGRLQGLPALVMVMSMTVNVPAGMDPQAYVEATMGPELRSTVAEYLTGRGVAVASAAVTLVVKPAIPGRRRLGEALALPPAPPQGRRLEATALSVTIMVGFGNVDDKRVADGLLTAAASNPALITDTFLEKLRTAGQPLPTVSGLDPPVNSQVYVANVTEFLGTVPSAVRTTAVPTQLQTQDQQTPVLITGPPTAAAEDNTARWLTGLSVGFGAGAVGMTSCCGVLFLICWQHRRRKKAGRIEPLKPDSPRTKHQTNKVSPRPNSEPQPALTLPEAAVLALAGSSSSPPPSPGASPRSVPGLSPSASPTAVGGLRGVVAEGGRRGGEPGATNATFRRSPSLLVASDGGQVSGLVAWKWSDGSAYRGQVLGGLLHGEGRFEWPTRKSYVGQWKEGKFHGHGLLRASVDKGWVYNGQFIGGECHGLGRCEWTTRGVWYDGEWTHGLQNGIGEAGAMRTVAWGTRGSVPPVKCHLYRMSQGERQENLGPSKLGGDMDSIISVVLEASEEDRQRALERTENMEDAYRSELQLVCPLWGLAIGHPDGWLPTRWGALVVIRILPNSAMARWNQAHGPHKQALCVQPNSVVWRVNGVTGDPYRMAEELRAVEGRAKLTLEVRPPPYGRFAKLRGSGQAGGRRPWAAPTEGRVVSSSSRPWLRKGAETKAPLPLQDAPAGQGTLRTAAQAGTEQMETRRGSRGSQNGRVLLDPLDPAPRPPQVSPPASGRPGPGRIPPLPDMRLDL